MAISKERLEELIEQGAKIYDLSCEQAYVIDFSEIVPNQFYDDGFNFYIKSKYGYNGKLKVFCYYDDVYEFATKEDAEWYKKFKRIPRTSYLDLPNYEEFIKDKIPIEINGCNGCYIELSCKHNYLRVYDYDCDYEYYKDTISKEHYIEACQILKSLFIGEY